MENNQDLARVSASSESGSPSGLVVSRVLSTFSAAFLDRSACRSLLVELLHPNGPTCPHCGRLVETEAQRQAFGEFRRLRCAGCGAWYTARTGTVLHGSGLDERQAVMIAVCLALGLDNQTAGRLVGVSPETVRQWRAKLK